MELRSMNTSESILEINSNYDWKHNDGMSPLALGVAALVALTSFVLVSSSRPRKFGDFPVVGKYEDLYEGLIEGTEKYPNSAFAIPTSPPMVIIPVPMIDEIKSLPETKVSSARELYRRAAGKYSKMGTNTVAAIRALRIDLNRCGTIIPTIREEAEFAFSQAIGEREDWTALPIYSRINQIVAIVSGRVFLGTPLCREAEWVDLATAWSKDVFALMMKTAGCPTWLLPWIIPLWSETKKVVRLRARAKKFLSDSFSEQISAKAKDELLPDGGRDTLLSWMLKYVAPKHLNIESLVRHQLGISWASIHTTTHVLTNVIFDLAAQPEYQDGLRKELEIVMGTCEGEMTQVALSQLKKMDSFMRESQRFSPVAIVGPMRLTVEPLTLSTGQTIPAGIPLGFFSMSINQSNSIYKFPPAEVFDGYRFFREREKEGCENKHQFGSTGPTETLDFGYGIHACPGRFFAATEIKILLAHILQNYDLKLEVGATRPRDSLEEVWFVADPKARVLLKSRKNGSHAL